MATSVVAAILLAAILAAILDFNRKQGSDVLGKDRN